MTEFRPELLAALPLMAVVLAPAAVCAAPSGADARAVAGQDTAYQAAVKRNDWRSMDRIMHPDFTLVLGDGAVVSRQELIEEARSGAYAFERQDEDPGTQSVRVWGDTAVVTARLWIKGVHAGKAFERRLWFSDTYVRTPQGWLYAFGQASSPLPAG